ncbi:TolC family protein [Achromobacter sp. Root83]|uniref:TolC family protein n=1 Tax=Achromobacter sp. Root83 TaxID=1736602 RepID=UPI0009E6E1FC|nr:TolC family protein [Achromobacter sp. Root83]
MSSFRRNFIYSWLIASFFLSGPAAALQAATWPTLARPPDLHHSGAVFNPPSACAENIATDLALGLDEILRAALCSNPSLKMSVASISEQEANVHLANSKYWPTLEANISGSRFSKNVYYKSFSEANYSLRGLTGATSLSLNWVLYDGGAREANLHKAEYLLAVARHVNSGVLMETLMATSDAFYKAQSATESVAAGREAVARSRTGVELAKRLLDLGVGARGDMLLAETTFIQARIDLGEAVAIEREALSEVASILGLRRDAEIRVTQQVKDVNPNLIQSDMAYLLEEGVRRNPAVMSAVEETNAAQANIALMAAERRPTVALAASTSRSLTPPTESATEQRIRGWSIGLQVKIPLFSGFSSFHSEQAAIAQRNSRIAATLKAEREAALKLWQQKEQIDIQLSKLVLISDLLNAAEKSHDLALGRYKTGVGTMLELLQAQKALTDAALEKNKTISALMIAQSRLAAMIDGI